ncbi:MAG: hypothetical protein V8Q27_09680 [Eubacteriales bacterium]
MRRNHLLRHPIVTLFIANPSDEIFSYANGYLLIVAPFYWLLGLLAVYRTSIQSMQNGTVSLCRLYDRARHASDRHHRPYGSYRLYGRLSGQSSGLGRSLRTADSGVLPDDSESAFC